MFTRKILSPDRQENAPTFCQSDMDITQISKILSLILFLYMVVPPAPAQAGLGGIAMN